MGRWFRSLGAGLTLAGAGCASLPTPEVTDLRARAGALGISSDGPRLVWVPKWKMYLREGQDAVYYRGAYYVYAKGQWHVSEGDEGAWKRVETPDEREARPSGPTTGDHVARVALRSLGSPYRWGGSSPAGFDCSGFVMYVYAKFGILLPHNAAQQYRRGTPVARGQLRPGDLVFFDRLRHNGIYIGDGRFVHSNKRGGGVRVSRLDDSWFRERWTGARRVLHPAPAVSEATGR
jgi:cell wall-associated NlpC family hydrolase